MDYGESLDEIVLFELPGTSAAERLLAHLRPTWLAWLQLGDATALVGTMLNPGVDDFARLLRYVQAWLDKTGLAAIRFEADGRVYVLEAERAALTVG